MSTKKDSKHKSSSTMTPMVQMFGEELLTSVDTKEHTNIVLEHKDIILLYFSASWCPPCRKFTPILIDFYNNFCKSNNIEIVFISSDQDIPSFNEYFKKMPWCSLPATDTAHIKQKLANRLNISGIPSLIVIDKNGYFVTDRTRNEISHAVGNEEKCNALIKQWKEAESAPIEEAVLSGSSPGGVLVQILSKLLSNPMYLVGLFYLVKRLLLKLQELGTKNQSNEL